MCQCVNTFLTVFGGFKHPAKPAMTWGSMGGLKPGPWNLFCMKNYPHELGLGSRFWKWWLFDELMGISGCFYGCPREMLKFSTADPQKPRDAGAMPDMLWPVPCLRCVMFLQKFPLLHQPPWLVGVNRCASDGNVMVYSSQELSTIPGWWYTYPSEKWWSSSVGMMTFPIYGKS